MEIAALLIAITTVLAVLIVVAVRAGQRHGMADGRTHLWAVVAIGWGIPVTIVWSRLLMSYGT
ncbi:MAG: hypothetical protein CME34_03165 [Gordonia sp.]|uniref:hypothetical protein n=1 Tax=Gordonia sp. (in: high G+C Gram-positive bacteria) TaxID=84139 RepID=UPI000C5C6028|nr:hypothetical protein [Gordonia sp. (in: high G+C Gram-positive bacteria)]MAU80870.1 hypothetical protein [Gordonia sp. (in: high G+C Gram-positive bacteria)]